MKGRNSQATWLELAALPHLGDADNEPEITLLRHDTGRGHWLSLTLDGRPLVSNSGERTTFPNVASAERFLRVAGITRYTLADQAAGNGTALAA